MTPPREPKEAGAAARVLPDICGGYPAGRPAVISDDGREIRLTIYGETIAAVPLAPRYAVVLARELLAAALPKLPR